MVYSAPDQVDAVESSGRLGRYRYVVERSLAWLVGYRRLPVRSERRADVLLGSSTWPARWSASTT